MEKKHDMTVPEFDACEINLLSSKARYDEKFERHYNFLKDTWLNDKCDFYTEKEIKYMWFIKYELKALM